MDVDPAEPKPVDRGALFVDVCGSTRLIETLGDAGARVLVDDCLDVVRIAAESHAGRVVDRIGDELFLVFPSCQTVVEAGIAVQIALAEARAAKRLPEHVRVRAGLHFGPVLTDGKRVFGETVHVARRAASVAKAGQVVTTDSTLRAHPVPAQLEARFLERVRLKGRSSESDLYELLFGAGCTVSIADGDAGANAAAASNATKLELLRGAERFDVDADRPTLTLGRDAVCDLVIDHPRASRVHARIELAGDTFQLVDLSTNGCSVERFDCEPAFVRRGTLQIAGEGRLVVGPAEDGESPTLAYRVLPAQAQPPDR